MVFLILGCQSASVTELQDIDVDPIDFGDDDPPGAEVYELDASAAPSLIFTAWGSGNSERHGTWTEYNVRVVRDGPALTDLSVDLVVNTDTVETGNTQMENHLRNTDFFDTPTHPQATFVSTSITETSGGFQITGDMTLRGTTLEISFPALIEERGEQLFSSAEIEFSRFEFGLVAEDVTAPGGDGVGDRVVLNYAVTLSRSGE